MTELYSTAIMVPNTRPADRRYKYFLLDRGRSSHSNRTDRGNCRLGFQTDWQELMAKGMVAKIRADPRPNREL